MAKIGIISVATNIYLDYWKTQAQSIDRMTTENFEVTLHVFTDDPGGARNFATVLKRVKVVAHEIPPYRWPEATLYRYALITKECRSLPEDVLMYLDADMIVQEPLSMADFSTSSGEGVTLVRHPGFYRPSGLTKLKLYFDQPKLFLNDLFAKFKIGALGSWETDRRSLAFVERKHRSDYFCGGTWWGYRDDFLRLTRDLAARVELDEKNSVMARWHDESHLNWWAAHHNHETKSPSYCYSISYPWLRTLPMIIQAVDKLESTRS